MPTQEQQPNDCQSRTAARAIHPEDLEVDDFVAILMDSCQIPTYFWCGFDTSVLPIDQSIRVSFLPYGAQEALVIKSICLPWILCQTYDGKHRHLDVRQVKLAKLPTEFAVADRAARLADQAGDSSEKKKSKKKNRNRKKSRR